MDYYSSLFASKVSGGGGGGGGGVDLSWIASSTPTPNVRNLFYALSNGTAEHGEFTLTSVPNSFIDVMTFTNLTEPQGIIFIDKEFYQRSEAISGLHQSGEILSFSWMDKAFTNKTIEGSFESPVYSAFNVRVNQTATNIGNVIAIGNVVFNGTTQTFRSYFQFSGKTFQIKSDYSNNNQYAYFVKNRTYIWIAY